jgi:hypothetical protein
VELAANYTWSNMQYMFCMPCALAHLLGPPAQRQKGILIIRKMHQAIIKALQLSQSSSGQKQSSLKALMKDVAWHQLQLSLEAFGLTEKLQQPDQQNEAMQDLVSLAKACYSGPATTKRALEDMFNDLKDKVSRSTKSGHTMNSQLACFNGIVHVGVLV